MFSQVMDLSSSSAASVGSEHISNEMLHSYLCGAGLAPETPSLQLLAYSATADSLGVAQSPIPKEKVWRFHKGWDLFTSPPNSSLTAHCLQASNCSLSTFQPRRYAMEGSATMLNTSKTAACLASRCGKGH